jgi:hypothetical protein
MAGSVDIKDHQSLLAWLAARSQADIAALACRSALRGLPGLDRKGDQYFPDTAALTTLRVARSALTSGAVVKYPAHAMQFASHNALNGVHSSWRAADRDADELPQYLPDIKRDAQLAAERAADPTYVARNPDAVADAARSAEYAAAEIADAKKYRPAAAAAERAYNFAQNVRDAAEVVFAEDADTVARQAVGAFPATNDTASWDQVRNDITALLQGRDLFMLPLWHSGTPDWRANAAPEMRVIWPDEPTDQWAFWRRWWDGVLDGQPLDRELQKEVALIPDQVWVNSLDKVANEIARIETVFTAEANSVQRELDDLLPAPKTQIAAVKAAMTRNRQALTPTFDDIEG